MHFHASSSLHSHFPQQARHCMYVYIEMHIYIRTQMHFDSCICILLLAAHWRVVCLICEQVTLILFLGLSNFHKFSTCFSHTTTRGISQLNIHTHTYVCMYLNIHTIHSYSYIHFLFPRSSLASLRFDDSSSEETALPPFQQIRQLLLLLLIMLPLLLASSQ